jgi:Anti-sigma-K factor rskA
MAARRTASALAELDPADRALLDLSLRRGQSDAELAELAGVEPAEVARRRVEALEQIAREARLDGDDLEAELLAAPDSDWLANTPAPTRRPRAPLPLLGAALFAVVAITAAIVVAVGGGSSAPDDSPTADVDAADVPGDAETQPQAAAPDSASGEAEPEPRDARSEIAIAPLRGVRTPGRVTVLVGRSPGARSIEARLRGLPNPRGRYELWLYDSRGRSARLGHLDAGTGRISARLPRRAGRYRFLDLSREPKPADARHSGQSLFRSRLRHLLGPRDTNGSR